jgi:hypothetical protein
MKNTPSPFEPYAMIFIVIMMCWIVAYICSVGTEKFLCP